jgi:hypothetical protein
MTISLSRVTLVLVSALVAHASSADETIRCGSKIITTGMTRAEVQQYCGKPASEAVENVDVRSGKRVVGKTKVYHWTYEIAGTTKVLVFDQDTLKSIE